MKPDEFDEDVVMRDGHCTFTHKEGLIIVSEKDLISNQLAKNENWFEVTFLGSNCRIFVSSDLIQEVAEIGLPLHVKKFLLRK